MGRWLRRVQWPSFALGMGCGVLLGWVAQQLPYVNWADTAAPLDHRPLVIRRDAKGDGRFGSPRSGNRRHRGVDLEAPVGSPVRAIRSGRVLATGRHRGLGRYLELEHGAQMRSLYAHLGTVAVEVGDRVRQGQVIATVGKTGNARHPLIKPHLHLEIVQAGQPLDPTVLGLTVVDPVAAEAEGTQADGGG